MPSKHPLFIVNHFLVLVMLISGCGSTSSSLSTPSMLRHGEYELQLEFGLKGAKRSKIRRLRVKLQHFRGIVYLEDLARPNVTIEGHFKADQFTATIRELGAELHLNGKIVAQDRIEGLLTAQSEAIEVDGSFVLARISPTEAVTSEKNGIPQPDSKSGPVLLMQRFKVPITERDNFDQNWRAIANYFQEQPGYIRCEIHYPVDENKPVAIMTITYWQQAEQLKNATATVEFRKLAARIKYPTEATLYRAPDEHQK